MGCHIIARRDEQDAETFVISVHHIYPHTAIMRKLYVQYLAFVYITRISPDIHPFATHILKRALKVVASATVYDNIQ